jgi:hypothetical protein
MQVFVGSLQYDRISLVQIDLHFTVFAGKEVYCDFFFHFAHNFSSHQTILLDIYTYVNILGIDLSLLPFKAACGGYPK